MWPLPRTVRRGGERARVPGCLSHGPSNVISDVPSPVPLGQCIHTAAWGHPVIPSPLSRPQHPWGDS